MSETSYILDTSALIELTLETNKGLKVFTLVKNARPLVPSIVIGELRSKLERNGIKADGIIESIRKSSRVLDLDFEIADYAGRKHVELRKKIKNISLADCIILAHGEKEGAKIITTDMYMEGFDAILL